MLKYCDKDGIEKTIIDNENINDYVSGSGSGSGVSDEWKESIEGSISSHEDSINSLNNIVTSHAASISSNSYDISTLKNTVNSHGNSINSLKNSVNSHGNSINSLNNTVNGLNARQNIRISLNGSTLYINW